MILNIYTYKGPKKSLIGPWISASYLVEDTDSNKESRVPNLKHMFERKDNLDRYQDLLANKLDIRVINSCEINMNGDYALRESHDQMIRRSFWRDRKFDVNIINKPTAWYERLTVICAVFYRTEYLRRMSRPNCDLLFLDSNFDTHLNELIRYKHLPPMYIWDKTMEAIKNVQPKPRWWFSEINYLRRELENDEPC